MVLLQTPAQLRKDVGGFGPQSPSWKHTAIKQCKHGLFLYNPNDLYIGRSLDAYGEWGEAELETLESYIKPDWLVLDLGANIGTHTVFFAQRAMVVYAVEPQRLIFQMLCANLALNELTNVVPLQAVIGAERGVASISTLDPEAKQNFGCFAVREQSGIHQVPIIPIDLMGLPRCDLIKADVEGMELDVLRGAQKTINEFRPVLFLENNQQHTAKEPLVAEVVRLGYRVFWHTEPYFNPHNYFEEAEDIWKAENLRPEVNMLCVPKEKCNGS